MSLQLPQMGSQHHPIPKKDGCVCMCVDFQNLNEASPKDNFTQHRDLLIDNMAGHRLLHSWMVISVMTK